ncbi:MULTISPECIES: hypothetical protein [unclassified Brevundimonas]|uniref:hypothetical protein n=1 Tax=unclassified Brevundimonas TaxID=2622653 RepID=UPI00257C3785|nr:MULTISPECIES: hypothetical protein [unclassified Brevundimonas]
MSRPPPPRRGDRADDEGAGTSDLAVRAGRVAKRLLAERGLVYLDDLAPDDCRTLLRAAWREAAAQLFSGADLDLVEAEIDIMIDSLDMTPSPPPMPRSEMN